MAGHHHHHVDPDSGDRRVLFAVLVNLGLTIAQIVGGVLAGSLALIADAIHNLSDAISLGIAFIARRIARKPSDSNMTFGYMRAEIIAALINYTTLIVIGLYLIYEAVFRLIDPQGVDGWLVVVIAGIALAVDLVTALLTFRLSKHSVNIRAAFLHNVADALGSIGVIVAGTLIILYDWRLVDPLVTLMIAGYILWQAVTEIGTVIRMLMLGTPPDADAKEIVAALRGLDGVADVHHVHLWQLDERRNSLEAHLVLEPAAWPRLEAVRDAAKAMLRARFAIGHTTLEPEHADRCCEPASTFGDSRRCAGHAHG